MTAPAVWQPRVVTAPPTAQRDLSVTVLMPVYNAGRHLAAAVESVLGQTWKDFELLIIDDGSDDGSQDYLDSLTDPRVRVVRQTNAGLVASLNRGLAEARHELVARMDADDLIAPGRLAEQVQLLTRSPEVVVVGSCYEVMAEDGATIDTVHLAAEPAYLVRQLYLRNPFAHGAVLFRRSAVLAAGGYRDDVGPVEDYELWCRLALRHQLGNAPTVLFSYRITDTSISVTAGVRQRACWEAVNGSFAKQRPLPAMSARQVAAEGRAHTDRYSSTCAWSAQRYANDHVQLARLLRRQGRHGDARRMLAGTALLVMARPRAAAGLPGLERIVRRVRAAQRR